MSAIDFLFCECERVFFRFELLPREAVLRDRERKRDPDLDLDRDRFLEEDCRRCLPVLAIV